MLLRNLKVRDAHPTQLINADGLFPNRFRKIREIKQFSDAATPLRIIDPLFYPTVKSGIRPIAGTFHQPMFHRIVVDVIKMPGIIPFITQGMFPNLS